MKQGIYIVILGFAWSCIMLGCTESRISDSQDNPDSLPDSVYIQQGSRIVSQSFDTLRNSLLAAIGSQGMDGAITFCNEKAYSITASYADSVVIRRTSLRYRNPDNKPDSLELVVLKEMDMQMDSAKTIHERIIRKRSAGEIHFFKPILTQAMCLNCHGTRGIQIKDNTLARIQQLYPEDRALNFKEGDLRGVWHIIFKSRQLP